MQLFLIMSFVFVCLGGGLLGARLLLAGMRTRTAPELAYGSALVAVQICLVGTTGLTWLAFYPPQRFQAWMRVRHTATARP